MIYKSLFLSLLTVCCIQATRKVDTGKLVSLTKSQVMINAQNQNSKKNINTTIIEPHVCNSTCRHPQMNFKK